MRDVAFPARSSVKSGIGVGHDERGLEIFSSESLHADGLRTIGETDFYGDRKYHYYAPAVEAGIFDSLMQSGLNLSLEEMLGNVRNSFDHRQRYSSPRLMAIVNVTPDSFFAESRLKVGNEMLEKVISSGPDIIDVGGESTRPGSSEISVSEEIERLSPVIDYIRSKTQIPISLDTRHPDVLDMFAEQVTYANDITGFRDPKMILIAAEHSLDCITMHMRGTPENMQTKTAYVDLIPEVISSLAESSERLQKAGVAKDRIVVDPGIGFSKGLKGNLDIIREIGSFRFGHRILVGVSRKSFIGKLTGEDASGRLPGTIAANSYLAMNGVDILRVHDPKETLEALKVLDAINDPKDQA